MELPLIYQGVRADDRYDLALEALNRVDHRQGLALLGGDGAHGLEGQHQAVVVFAANTTVVTISDTSSLMVNATVDERNVSAVQGP